MINSNGSYEVLVDEEEGLVLNLSAFSKLSNLSIDIPSIIVKAVDTALSVIDGIQDDYDRIESFPELVLASAAPTIDETLSSRSVQTLIFLGLVLGAYIDSDEIELSLDTYPVDEGFVDLFRRNVRAFTDSVVSALTEDLEEKVYEYYCNANDEVRKISELAKVEYEDMYPDKEFSGD